MKKRILSWLLLLCICFLTVVQPQTVWAGDLKLNASVNKKNIMKLMKKYDPDGAYILEFTTKFGDDPTRWYSGKDRIIDGIEVAVHEETHGYSIMDSFYNRGVYNGETIYIGNKKGIHVTFTNVFHSQKMAKSIPKRLRTFRYNTYVATSEALSSNIHGPYGLLNEFTAYYWGMHASDSLYPYLKKFPATYKTWSSFVNAGANNRLAYAEFRFFILKYLSYAKKHDKAVYNGIVNNKNFAKAYVKIESKFRKEIKTYEKDLEKIVNLMNKNGLNASVEKEYFNYGGYGTSLFRSDYDKLIKEMKKSEYTSIEKKLKKTAK